MALLHSYDSRWAIEFQKHTEKYDQIAILKSYYAALHKLAQSVDVVNPYDNLDQYKLVVAPSLNVLPEDLAAHLREYVQGGGHLVLGPRSGMKDQYNALLPQRQPGYLVDVLGWASGAVLRARIRRDGKWDLGRQRGFGVGRAVKANSPGYEGARELSASSTDGLITSRRCSHATSAKGSITYIGAVLDDKTMAAAAEWMVKQSGVVPVFGAVPDGIEVCRRERDGKNDIRAGEFLAETANRDAAAHDEGFAAGIRET